jgi:hypothetical protein
MEVAIAKRYGRNECPDGAIRERERLSLEIRRKPSSETFGLDSERNDRKIEQRRRRLEVQRDRLPTTG